MRRHRRFAMLRLVGSSTNTSFALPLVMVLLLVLVAGLSLVGSICQASSSINETSSQPTTSKQQHQQQQTTTANRTLDFKTLASEFQQDTLKTDTLIKVINDTHGIEEATRRRLYNLISEHKIDSSNSNTTNRDGGSGGGGGDKQAMVTKWVGGKPRRIVYEDTIFTKRALREIEGKMNLSYEGESRSDPAIHWVILYNDTTILVVRSANKYYYWTYGQSVGSFIIFCMIVVGNLSILHRLKSCRRRRSNVNYFIVQLAIADLLVGVFSVTLDSWLRIQKAFLWGLFACRASKYISALFIYSSTNLLVALSVDRWEAVVKPLAFTKNRSRGYHLVAASWLLAFISALPVTFFTKIKEIDGLPQCWIDLNSYGWRLYMLYLTSLLLIVPTLIIAICYIHIVYTIWSKGRLVADQQRERTSHSNYGASPESLALEFSSSSRLTTKLSSNLVAADGPFPALSSRYERETSRRLMWSRRGKKHTCKPSGNQPELELGGGRSRRASSGTLAEAPKRLALFRRTRTIETTQPEAKQPPLDGVIEGPRDLSTTGGHLEGSNQNVGCNNEPAMTTHDGERGSCRTGTKARATGIGKAIEHQRTTVSDGSSNSSSSNGRGRAIEPIEDGRAIIPPTNIDTGVAPQHQRHQQSGQSGLASRGLRILSFARSRSSSSSSSSLTTTTPSASSSSSLTSKSRLASSARSSVATQIMVPSASGRLQLTSKHLVEQAKEEKDRASSAALGQQLMMVGGGTIKGAATDDKRMTVAPDVDEAVRLAAQAAITVNGEQTDSPQAQALQATGPRHGDDRMLLVHGQQEDQAKAGGECQSGDGNDDTMTSSQEPVDPPDKPGSENPAAGESGSRKNSTTMNHRDHQQKNQQRNQHKQVSGKHKPCLPSKTFTSNISMTTTNKGPSESCRVANHDSEHNPSSQSAVDMQTESHAISRSCDRKARRAKRSGSDGGVRSGPTTGRQFGQAHQHQLQQSTKQQPQQPLQALPVATTEPAQSSGGRDQDFVAQQHGSGVIPKARIKTIKMTLVIVVAYILCWSPFLILNLCGVFGLIKNDTNVSHALLTLSQSLAHLNSAVNPIIFWLFSSRRSQTNANKTNTVAGLAPTNHQANHNHQQKHHRHSNKIATNGAL